MNERQQVLRDTSQLLQSGEPVVLITVSQVRGSTPREVGAKMVVTATSASGTIGGGELEFQAIEFARSVLEQHSQETLADAPAFCEEKAFVLGTNCGQCCGGAVSLFFQHLGQVPAWLDLALTTQPSMAAFTLSTSEDCSEPQHEVYALLDDSTPESHLYQQAEKLHSQGVTAARLSWQNESGATQTSLIEIYGHNRPVVAVFGAGHVGQAVVEVLQHLDIELVWIDSRKDMFRDLNHEDINIAPHGQPAHFAAQLPAGSLCLIMTHSHTLDFDICTTLLQRGDIPFCGLIGSTSKRRRFERLLKQAGLAELSAHLTCPIGVDGISGKTPREVAIAVSAQVLQQLELARSGMSHQKEAVGAALSH